ncbi:dihydropteroate synthase [Gryllotalpicola sp.]|uniref:dihydropteroate synthase n=1 Tax=Gryllotalpicola sp. TaxID=1932787 RepID=UPI002605BFB4|nr:dihydropteroate synthase [Gryllotalpicola sp.]
MESQRTRIVGILEPLDELDAGSLLDAGRRLASEGADLVNVDTVTVSWPGRPDRVLLARLVGGLAADGVQVAVTTTSADIAVVAADHGAELIIDPSGGVADPFMPRIVAAGGLGYVVGQWSIRHASAQHATGEQSAADFIAAVERNVLALLDAGVDRDRLILDSGAGLFVQSDEEWRMLDHLERLGQLGYPLLVDAARPLLLASLLPDDATDEQRDAAALAVGALAAEAGAWGIQVRNVARTSHALRGLLRYGGETIP